MKNDFEHVIGGLYTHIGVLALTNGNSTHRFRSYSPTLWGTRKVGVEGVQTRQTKGPFSYTSLFRRNTLNIRVVRVLEPVFSNKVTRLYVFTSRWFGATNVRVYGVMFEHKTTLCGIGVDTLIGCGRDILGLTYAKHVRPRVELGQGFGQGSKQGVSGQATTPRDTIGHHGFVVIQNSRLRGVLTRRVNVETFGHTFRVHMGGTRLNGLTTRVIMGGLQVVLHTSSNGQFTLYLQGARTLGDILGVLKRFEPFYTRFYI